MDRRRFGKGRVIFEQTELYIWFAGKMLGNRVVLSCGVLPFESASGIGIEKCIGETWSR